MAIVLGVTGILFGGLWRLLSTSNVQARDQATANQHAQLVSAVSAYLQSPGVLSSATGGGESFLKAMSNNEIKTLTLPSSAFPAGNTSCATNLPSNPGLCNFLPPGFSAATVNPYGQTYNINVLKDDTASSVAPATYSFMILTSSGDAIPDTSGGRISAMIGGDGGFVYNSAVCGTTPANACGAFGGWGVTLSTYGFTATVGHIASRTYYSSSYNASDIWLARKFVTGDTTYKYNTMSTPLYFGGQNVVFGSSSIEATNTTSMNVQGGVITLGTTGQIVGTTGSTAGSGGGRIELSGNMNSSSLNALVLLKGGCTVNSGGAGSVPYSATCTPVLQLYGDANVVGQLQAYGFYAANYIYSSSDVSLKTDIKSLSGALTDIMKIRPVSFAYKANGRKNMGVIAQELEKIYPELVELQKDGYKAVAYEGLIAPLIAAVQELKRENDLLRTQMREQIMRQEKTEESLRALQKNQ
ncbi:MAG: tail fiber domain-containing protein [Bdellovibrionales bacterium]